MKNVIKRLIVKVFPWNLLSAFLLLLSYSHSSQASCAEQPFQCWRYSGDQEQSLSCDIKICANANSMDIYWSLADGTAIHEHGERQQTQILLNQQPAFALPQAILQDELHCISSDQQVIYCVSGLSI
ncbi:hypothetical protein [Agarivorans sp.]|uniref:hypothetical protein n=1 Tax=Agarivorans sp. TaxID=1872412 RepID=UPI003D04C62A